MEWELIVATVAILSFILLWMKNIIYNKIQKRKDDVLKIIENKTNTILEDYKNKIQKNKNEFILDIVGLYHLENKIKNADNDLRDIFIGFIVLGIYSFALTISEFNIVLIALGVLILEVALAISGRGFYSLNKTFSNIEKFDKNIPPREFVKKIRI